MFHVIFEHPITWVILAVVLIAVGAAVWLRRFSEEARLGRRRRKNNARVVPTVRRPIVKLIVRTPKE